MIEILLKTNWSDISIIVIGVACFWNSIVISDFWNIPKNIIDDKTLCDLPRWRFLLLKFISCPNCLSFWTTLILTFNPLIAGMSFIGSKIIENYLIYGKFTK